MADAVMHPLRTASPEVFIVFLVKRTLTQPPLNNDRFDERGYARICILKATVAFVS